MTEKPKEQTVHYAGGGPPLGAGVPEPQLPESAKPKEQPQAKSEGGVFLHAQVIHVPHVEVEESVDEAIAGVERDIERFKSVRSISLRLTTTGDWLDMGEKSKGPYLKESGAQSVAVPWGVHIFDAKKEVLNLSDDKGPYVLVIFEGKAYSSKLGRMVTDIGTCSSRDDFFALRDQRLVPLSDVDLTDVIKAAKTNLDVRLIKKVVGLGSTTWEELALAGITREMLHKVSFQAGRQKREKNYDEIFARLPVPDQRRAKDLWDMLLQIAGGTAEEASALLKADSGFPTVDPQTNEPGRREAGHYKELTTSNWVNKTYGRVLERYEKMFGKRGPDQPAPIHPDQERKEPAAQPPRPAQPNQGATGPGGLFKPADRKEGQR